MQTKHITAIQPTEQQTVDFENLATNLPPAAYGATNETITVAVGKVPGETNLANNTVTYPSFFTLP